MPLDRRSFLSTCALTATAVGAMTQGELHTSGQENAKFSGVGYGFSLYGMKELPLQDALQICAMLGYDCVELPTMADWQSAPEKLSTADRVSLRDQLTDLQLRLSALMENVTLLAESTVHAKNLERLHAAGELGHELSPTEIPVIETIMGGSPTRWEDDKGRMAERLMEWAKAGEQSQTVIAIKAHVSGAAHRPEHIRWLLDQVKSPWIKAAFDYSHFQLRDIDLASAWKSLSTDTAFIHIKDSVGTLDKFQFVLPGEGTIDYVEYLTMLRNSNCQADVVVEVSAQLHNRTDYDPRAAAKKSYAPIAAAFKQAGLKRRTSRKNVR
jgi:sugar phosphate isomerase/epimerase